MSYFFKQVITRKCLAMLKLCVHILLLVSVQHVFGQTIVEHYFEKANDSLRIGQGENDFFPYIQKGYTLALPDQKDILGTIIFLEGSKFDAKNKSAKQIYKEANNARFAVLSVSTEIPLDFYFSEKSSLVVHEILESVFNEYNLPRNNIFLFGVGLSGHRAMKYVEFLKRNDLKFMINVSGIVLCDSALDWVRQYNEGARDVRINYSEGSVWEGRLTTFLLNQNLNGTPKSNLDNYLNFSTYSYFDEKARHISFYKDLSIRAYMQVAIEYWLEEKRKTPFDNNGPDMVGLIAELKLAGNTSAELKVIYPEDSKSDVKNVFGTWLSVDKKELMDWVVSQMR